MVSADERQAPMEDEATTFDKIWQHAILYKNPDQNAFIRDFELSGRLQADAAWFDADEGDFNDLLWRRFRFGFTMTVAGGWMAQLEAELDLNENVSDWYRRLTDAYVGWNPSEKIMLKVLKHSAGFTLDGATSSKKLLTMQRNNLTNNLWFTAEYFTGISAMGELDEGLTYRVGIFANDGNEEISSFDAKYFILTSLGYDFTHLSDRFDTARFRLEYVYNKEDTEANTRPFTDVVSLVGKLGAGPWGLWTDASFGKGFRDQSDIWGLSLMPFYNSSDTLQWVFRYTYLSSDDDNGLRMGRYEREIVSGRGDKYNEFYAGVNLYFYGHKLKWQTGLQYTRMDDAANDGGRYRGWGLTTGLRAYW